LKPRIKKLPQEQELLIN
jgi:ribosomal protein L14E/L6E/L27E